LIGGKTPNYQTPNLIYKQVQQLINRSSGCRTGDII